MTNLKDKIKNLGNWIKENPKKGILYTGLGLATLVGTFGGNEGGLPPIYTKKVGTWGGINVGLVNQFQENSKFYGISIGLVNVPVAKDDHFLEDNSFYGTQIGLLNCSGNLNGNQIGIFQGANNLKGISIGGLNGSNNLTGAQIGIANKNQKGWSVLLGFGNGDEKIK